MNSAQPNNLAVKVKLFYLILSAIVLLIVIYFIENFTYKLINLVVYFDSFSIIIDVGLHILLVRYIVKAFLFPGSNFIVKRILRHENGKVQATQFSKIIAQFKSNLEKIKTTSNTEITNNFIRAMRINLKQTKEIISYFIKIFSFMHERCTQSEYQRRFFLSITILNDNIQDSGLELLLDDVIKEINISNSFFDFKDANLDRHIKKMLLNAYIVEDHINDFLLKQDWRRNLKNFWSNDIFGSLFQYRTELFMNFEMEEYTVETADKKHIDVVLIKSEKKSNVELIRGSFKCNRILISENEEKKDENKEKNRNLIIICGPNGAPFEQFSRNLRLGDLYLNNNIDIMVWNYRGYGFTSGSPTFSNIKHDAEIVLNFAKGKQRWNKIGVHGLSMGGLGCCSLASTNLVDVCIADRTFSSIEDIVLTFPFGYYLQYFYKLLLFSKATSVEKYLKSNCTKIILNDPLDTIVKEGASLKTGISKEVINRIFFEENKMKRKYNSILDLILTEQEKVDFHNNLISIFHIMMLYEKNKIKNKTVSVNRNSQTNALLEPGKIKRNLKYTNLNEEQTTNDDNFGIESNATKNEEISKIFREINTIFTRFESTGDSLSSIRRCGENKWRAKIFIDNFFTNMFVWGCIKTDDQDTSDKIMSHKEISKRFKALIENLESLLNKEEIQNHKNCEFFKNLENIFGYIKILEIKFIEKIHKANNDFNYHSNNSFSGEHFESSVNTLEVPKDIEKLNIGNLIPLSCGHNGNLSDTELHLIKFELIKAKFI